MRPALIALLAAALIAPAAAVAQSSPFAPLPQAPPPAPETVAADPGTGAGDGGISGLQQGFLIAAGLLLVLGIGFAIARDARHHGPGDPRSPSSGSTGSRTTDGGVGERKKPDPRAAQKQKAAAKRARQARKKNRPVRK